jgi:hypothetical protein
MLKYKNLLKLHFPSVGKCSIKMSFHSDHLATEPFTYEKDAFIDIYR